MSLTDTQRVWCQRCCFHMSWWGSLEVSKVISKGTSSNFRSQDGEEGGHQFWWTRRAEKHPFLHLDGKEMRWTKISGLLLDLTVILHHFTSRRSLKYGSGCNGCRILGILSKSNRVCESWWWTGTGMLDEIGSIFFLCWDILQYWLVMIGAGFCYNENSIKIAHSNSWLGNGVWILLRSFETRRAPLFLIHPYPLHHVGCL